MQLGGGVRKCCTLHQHLLPPPQPPQRTCSIRWWFSDYNSLGLAPSVRSGSSLLLSSASRIAEPWWETQQRLLTARRARAKAAAEAAEPGDHQQHGHRHQDQQQAVGPQQRTRGGLAGGDPMVAIASGASRCKICHAVTTTRCSKCKSVSYW